MTEDEYQKWWQEQLGKKDEEEMDPATQETQLRKTWKSTYRKAFKRPDRTPDPVVESHLSKLLSHAGSYRDAERCITALFHDPKLKWVNSISVEWLSSPTNFSKFLAPLLSTRSSSDKTDWKKQRSGKTVVRKRRL